MWRMGQLVIVNRFCVSILCSLHCGLSGQHASSGKGEASFGIPRVLSNLTILNFNEYLT